MINFNKNTNMRTVTLKLPDNIELNEKEISIMLAAQLYNLGKMSLGQAANLVDLNKAAFINELGKYNVTVFGETLEELEQELKNG
jgi:predicted HTH domain antitoxin